MANFLDHVRRKSGFPMDSGVSDDDRSYATEESDKRKYGSLAVQIMSMPRSLTPKVRNSKTSNSPSSQRSSTPTPNDAGGQGDKNQLTVDDLEICQRLDEEYERALEEREIGYNARYASVRQSAVLSVFFMVTFLSLGAAFYIRQAAWTIPESLLFSIYAITTVGYGRSEMPTTPGFQAYTIFYILVGIAALTIMVAQVYQCIALEATRAQHARDKTEITRRGMDVLRAPQHLHGHNGGGVPPGENDVNEIVDCHHQTMSGLLDVICHSYDRAKYFFRHNEIGKGASVVFPLATLILVGAVVVGPIEGWTFLEALYFSVVSLTTVGFGDYTPTKNASIWFCIFWLPFSIGFMSIYLGNVAAFYIRLSDRNIQRIERHMRRRLQRAKEKAEMERAEVLRRAYRGQEIQVEAATASLRARVESEGSSEFGKDNGPNGIPLSHAQSLSRRKGFDVLPMNEGSDNGDLDGSEGHISLFGASDSGNQRRQRIIQNTIVSRSDDRSDGPTMQSMRDIVRAVRANLDVSQEDGVDRPKIRSGPEVQFMSIRSTQTITTHNGLLRRVQIRKPSFALRVLVQERFAEIIATDVAGFHSAFEIKETTMSVTMDSLMETCDKWLIPRRARKPFRSVAFEALYFVGERDLITRGADSLFALSPFEFHGLFSPLVAAMGDAETMETWLSRTDVLAAADLSGDAIERSEPIPRAEEAYSPQETTAVNTPSVKETSIEPEVPKVRMSSGMA